MLIPRSAVIKTDLRNSGLDFNSRTSWILRDCRGNTGLKFVHRKIKRAAVTCPVMGIWIVGLFGTFLEIMVLAFVHCKFVT